jgi:hypothetical protein
MDPHHRVRRMPDAPRHETMSVLVFDRCHAQHREPMSLRTRLLLRFILRLPRLLCPCGIHHAAGRGSDTDWRPGLTHQRVLLLPRMRSHRQHAPVIDRSTLPWPRPKRARRVVPDASGRWTAPPDASRLPGTGGRVRIGYGLRDFPAPLAGPHQMHSGRPHHRFFVLGERELKAVQRGSRRRSDMGCAETSA